MDTTPQEDWRAQALRNMELADEPIPQRQRQDGWLGLVIAKLALLVVLSAGLVWFAGYGMLFATGLVGWYLFWPR
jgi:hypothetical protein